MEEKTNPIGVLSWSLDVECPCCKEDFDAVAQDADMGYTIAKKIFNYQWDDVAGSELTCPSCSGLNPFEFRAGLKRDAS